MRLAAVTDVHAHNAKRFGGSVERSLNRRCRDVLVVLERSYKLAHSEGCTLMCILGDLVDGTSPEPQLIGELLRIVHEARVKLGILTVLLVGNHDQQSDQEGDHALAPFLPFSEDAVVVGEPSAMNLDTFDLVMLPHSAAAPASERLKALLGGLPRGSDRQRILLMHAGVSDDKTAPFLRGSSDSVELGALTREMASAGVPLCLAGNWHDHRTWTTEHGTVVQVGALVPTGFDNPGLDGYGGVIIVDTDSMRVETIFLEGPRFVPVRGMKAMMDLLGSEQPKDRRLYVRATVEPGELSEASKRIGRAHSKGEIAAGEVLADSADRVVEARKAAGAARSADTLANALDGFVSEMPLEEGVTREVVMEKCRGYLKSGG